MRQGIWDEIRNIFRQRNNLSILIFLNLAVFVVVLTINLGFFFAGNFRRFVVAWCFVKFLCACTSSVDGADVYVRA